MKRYNAIIILILLIVAVVSGSVAVHIVALNGGSNRPNFGIIDEQGDLAFGEKVASVYATVRNDWAAGNATIYAKVVVYAQMMIARQNVFLKEGESKDLTFEFDKSSVISAYWWEDAAVPHYDANNAARFSFDVWAEP